MLPLFLVIFLATCAHAAQPSCDPKVLGASINDTLPLAKLPGCLCVSNKGCEIGTLAVTPDSFEYNGAIFRKWVGARDEDHWNIKEPPMAADSDLIPVREGENIVLVLCDKSKTFKEVLVVLTQDPDDETLANLKEKYDIEIGIHVANCGFLF